MSDNFEIEIAKKFIKELTPSEQFVFLKKVKEAVYIEKYIPDENLFYYCYFLTLRERIRALLPYRTNGLIRYTFAETLKEIEDCIKEYKEKLRKRQNETSELDLIK